MKRVDFFLKCRKKYTLERFVIDRLETAFQTEGIQTKKLSIEDGTLFNYLREIEDDPPDWTFSVQDLFVQKQPLCDVTHLPHFCWEPDSLSHSLTHLQSTLGHIGYIDQKALAKNMLFLPHGVDSSFQVAEETKMFDVVFFDDLVDIEDVEKNWAELFPKEVCEDLRRLSWACIEDPTLSPLKFLIEETEKKPLPCSLNYLLFLVEEYVKAYRTRLRIEKMQDVHIHVFGEHIGNNWLKRLKNADNVYLHGMLPYTEYFTVLKKSKVLVRDQWKTSHGSDEWIFSALALGCHVVTNGSTYLSEQLSLPVYRTLDEMEEMVQVLLNQPFTKKCDLQPHTFEKRAQTILSYMQSHR